MLKELINDTMFPTFDLTNDTFEIYSNLSQLSCGPQRRSPAPGTYTYYISLYIFPIFFIVGTFGNAMILIILRRIKQKNNAFLSAMALSDFLFFIPMFLLSLNAYDCLAVNETFLYFSYHAQTPIVAIANWFSTASTW